MLTFSTAFKLIKEEFDVNIEDSDYAVNCPFHVHEEIPSCFFDHSLGIYHCFSGKCNKKGNIVTFYKDYYFFQTGVYISYKESMLKLHIFAGIPIEKNGTVVFKGFTRTKIERKELPLYMKYTGIERIECIQGYYSSIQELQNYLDEEE